MAEQKDVIKTDREQKQDYRANMIYFYSNPFLDRYEYIYQIVQMLINDKEINNLIEQVGLEEAKRLINNCNVYVDLRHDILEYRKQLFELTRGKYKGENLKSMIKQIEDRIEQIIINLPIVHADLILVKAMLIKRTDLKDIEIKDYAIREAKDKGYQSFRRDRDYFYKKQESDFDVSEKD